MLITEQFVQGFAFSEATVDRETGIIQNVSLLGRVSANGRTYSEQAMRQAAELHKGAGVYVDHPGRSEASERDGVRSVRDLAGKVISSRVVGDRVKGSVQALKGTDPGELLLALAATMPEAVGFSHRATGTTSRDGSGAEIVDSVTAVHGADIVSDPATVNGLFESISKKYPLDLRSLSEQSHVSFDDISKRVRTALTEIEQPGDNWLHIEAIFDDRVIYQIDDGPMFQRSWEMDGRGNVTLGNGRIEVHKLTTFEPVKQESTEMKKFEPITPEGIVESSQKLFGHAFREPSPRKKQSEKVKPVTDDTIAEARYRMVGGTLGNRFPGEGDANKAKKPVTADTIAEAHRTMFG